MGQGAEVLSPITHERLNPANNLWDTVEGEPTFVDLKRTAGWSPPTVAAGNPEAMPKLPSHRNYKTLRVYYLKPLILG